MGLKQSNRDFFVSTIMDNIKLIQSGEPVRLSVAGLGDEEISHIRSAINRAMKSARLGVDVHVDGDYLHIRRKES